MAWQPDWFDKTLDFSMSALQKVSEWMERPRQGGNEPQPLALFSLLTLIAPEARLATLNSMAAETILPANIAATFSGGRYASTVLQNNMTAYRYSGGVSGPVGSFLTTGETISQISSPVSASIALRLPVGATAETLNTFTIPAGTRIFTGGVAGGADTASQIFIQNPSVLIPH